VETSAAGGQAFTIGTPGGRGRTTSPFGNSTSTSPAPEGEARAYALSLNGEPAVIVDPRGLETTALREHPVVLRAGRNRLMLSYPLGERTAFAVRVLGADGWPLPGLLESRAGDTAGRPVDATPPDPSKLRRPTSTTAPEVRSGHFEPY